MKKEQWKRPCEFEIITTHDPKQMLGKYLVKPLVKKWTEDFIDEDTGQIVSVERSETLYGPCHIDKDTLSELMFFIQSGDVKDVEVCEMNIADMQLFISHYYNPYLVELIRNAEKYTFAVQAQDIPQAIDIAAEFGQEYCGFKGWVVAKKVAPINAYIIPYNHKCIPEKEQDPLDNHYFRVTVLSEYDDGERFRTVKHDYIILADEVGVAKERAVRFLDIVKAERIAKGDRIESHLKQTILKAVPFPVHKIIPEEYSHLYRKEPTR